MTPITYLGNKGYTILKDSISTNEQHFIRNELTIKPFVPKGMFTKANNFPVYRESARRIYVPRYYGEKLFGFPNSVTIPDGEEISLEFSGKLRENQIDAVNTYCKIAKLKGSGLLELPCGFGKTVISLNIISRICKKTLIIVHKEFLMEQWKERIQQFLPNAKIGKIQGQTVDIESKDIVIAMLQSLVQKDYPKEVFESFGLTIIDETHHMAAEVFSRALFKIVTPYMLGLSATMTRKDGLSKVFKMFLGEIEFKVLRPQSKEVVVQSIQYKVDDDDFNETPMDARGYIQFGKIITKLCEYYPRKKFILEIIKNSIQDPLSNQIMVLSQNKSLLEFLFQQIEIIFPGYSGFYVGGMKQKDLQISESKKVVLATYAMAEEALDIKTLTTLIMATPRTSVTQAVGRILRSKHQRPLVIDIVDSHDVFKRQSSKRQAYYLKSGFTIKSIKHIHYPNGNWEIIDKEKKSKSEKKKCLIPKPSLSTIQNIEMSI